MPIQARLLRPAEPLREQAPLILQEQPKPEEARHDTPAKPAKPTPPPKPPTPEQKQPNPKTDWVAEVRKQFTDLQHRGLFYPEEAIIAGLEGEAVVLLFLDEQGNTVAARIEKSSGHKLLDDAALQAVRSLRSLPAAAPRETQLPVRFRLRH